MDITYITVDITYSTSLWTLRTSQWTLRISLWIFRTTYRTLGTFCVRCYLGHIGIFSPSAHIHITFLCITKVMFVFQLQYSIYVVQYICAPNSQVDLFLKWPNGSINQTSLSLQEHPIILCNITFPHCQKFVIRPEFGWTRP